MELLELLDLLDETAPRSCQTCRHMATHSRCNGCLEGVDGKPTPRGEPYPYRNWEPGNWLRELHAAEVRGTRNIVISGQGEADFCAVACPEAVAKHLHYVAEQCGYYCGRLRRDGYDATLAVNVDGTEYTLHWYCDKLTKISAAGRNCWQADDPSVRAW